MYSLYFFEKMNIVNVIDIIASSSSLPGILRTNLITEQLPAVGLLTRLVRALCGYCRGQASNPDKT